MKTGAVKWFNATKGFGFIKPDDSDKDDFVHISSVQRAGLTGLNEGQRVEYELEQGRNGKMAVSELKTLD
ncbi:MAG: cold-shock protein [Rhodospirillales bacterium]